MEKFLIQSQRVAIPESIIGSTRHGSGWFGQMEINSVKNK